MNSSSRKSLSPPAIWAHFAQQAAWKDWVIAALLVLNATTVLAGARLLSSTDPHIQLTSGAVLALAIGTAAGLAGGDLWPYAAAATVAGAACWLPLSAPRAA